MPPRKKRAEENVDYDSPSDFEDEILSRYLVDKKDNILGESIGIDGENLILKHKDKFYLIPRASVKLVGKKLVLKRKVDWVAALAKGEGWKREELDPLWGKEKKKGASKKPAKKPVKKPTKKPVPKKESPKKRAPNRSNKTTNAKGGK